jgi:hypothetical protein
MWYLFHVFGFTVLYSNLYVRKIAYNIVLHVRKIHLFKLIWRHRCFGLLILQFYWNILHPCYLARQAKLNLYVLYRWAIQLYFSIRAQKWISEIIFWESKIQILTVTNFGSGFDSRCRKFICLLFYIIID